MMKFEMITGAISLASWAVFWILLWVWILWVHLLFRNKKGKNQLVLSFRLLGYLEECELLQCTLALVWRQKMSWVDKFIIIPSLLKKSWILWYWHAHYPVWIHCPFSWPQLNSYSYIIPFLNIHVDFYFVVFVDGSNFWVACQQVTL